MTQIAPSILAADFANLERDCRKVVTPQNPMLHFDVMDGIFVPNISVGLPVLNSLKKALPEAVYDVHLMISKPARYAAEFIKQGADFVTFHIEAENDVEGMAKIIHAGGAKVGVSLRPGTPAEVLYPYLTLIDMVLVMSVEPGFGGQSFMPQAPGRIAQIRAQAQAQGALSLLIEVDGGVDETTAPLCIEAGADILVAGSAVFGKPDPAAAVRALCGA